MSQGSSEEELNIKPQYLYSTWRFLILYIAPAGIIIVFLNMLFN